MKTKWGVFVAVFAVAIIVRALLPYVSHILMLAVLVFGLTIIVPLYLNFLKAAIKLYAAILALMACLYVIGAVSSMLTR